MPPGDAEDVLTRMIAEDFQTKHGVPALFSIRQGCKGRGQEIGFWLRSVEFAGWFKLYVVAVPQLGYLPTTILLAVALSARLG